VPPRRAGSRSGSSPSSGRPRPVSEVEAARQAVKSLYYSRRATSSSRRRRRRRRRRRSACHLVRCWGRKVAVRDNQTTSDTPTCRSPLSSLCHLRLSQRHHVLTIYEVDSRKRWANRPLNTLMLVNFIHQVNWQQTRKE